MLLCGPADSSIHQFLHPALHAYFSDYVPPEEGKQVILQAYMRAALLQLLYYSWLIMTKRQTDSIVKVLLLVALGLDICDLLLQLSQSDISALKFLHWHHIESLDS